ncbi:MAG: FAD:protein FMN transferase [Candidatus Omnitrophota bacterium]|nr:FAD:protein FMN transferase [Candidatus Omnitrophota bacterium]
MTAAKITVFFLLLALALFAISFYNLNNEKIITETRLLMGTVVQIKAVTRDCGVKAARDAIKRAFSEMERVEGVFSVYKENSEISRVNALKADEKLKISDEVFWLIKKSIDYNKKTKGAFDITVKPLVDLWKRVKTAGQVPDAEEIRAVLERIGSKHIELIDASRTISFKKDGMGIDLGGIAKGYAVDMAVKTLKAGGIRGAVVHAGGDMYCVGVKAPGRPWKVGVQHPRDRGKILVELRLKNKAVNTSGDYERYFTIGTRRYSHIIDPRNGYPIGDNIVSATVISDDPVAGDILATTLCILGKEGLGIIKAMNGIDAMVVTLENGALKSSVTDGMKERYGLYEKTLS